MHANTTPEGRFGDGLEERLVLRLVLVVTDDENGHGRGRWAGRERLRCSVSRGVDVVGIFAQPAGSIGTVAAAAGPPPFLSRATAAPLRGSAAGLVAPGQVVDVGVQELALDVHVRRRLLVAQHRLTTPVLTTSVLPVDEARVAVTAAAATSTAVLPGLPGEVPRSWLELALRLATGCLAARGKRVLLSALDRARCRG